MVKEIIVMIINVFTDIGLWKIIHCAFKNAIKPHKVNKATKACIFVGEMVITGVISEKTNNYVEKTTDTAAKFLVNHGWDKKFLKLVHYKEENTNGGHEQSDEC